jgi:uncharacterized protein YdeI (YjbR/CyaY-like superfamily)
MARVVGAESLDRESPFGSLSTRKESEISSVYYPEAVDEALCFGWVDSKPNKRDERQLLSVFCQKKSEEQLEPTE